MQWESLSPDVRTQIAGAILAEPDPFLQAFLDSHMMPPSVPGASTAKEEFLPLLRAASEIEHALMVQYLFAYFTSGSDKSSAEVFLKVAIQEMGHLFTVQNLLRAFNQEVHLILPDPTMEGVSEAFPFPLLLQPASISSLAQYVTAESPLAATLAPELKAIAEDAIADAAIEVRHVGMLYLKLYWLTQPSSSPFGPWQPPLSTGWEAVLGKRHLLASLNLNLNQLRSWKASWDVSMDDLNFLETATTRRLFVGQLKAGAVPINEQVCRDLYAIAAQGEGWATDNKHVSHFELFAGLYKNWKLNGVPGAIIKAGRNPWVGEPSANATLEAQRITQGEAVALGKVFNLRYERVLLLIALTFTARALSLAEELQTEAVDTEMSQNLSQLATELLKRPLKEGGGFDLHAGPPFQAPKSIPTDFDGIRARLASLKQETETISLPAGNALDTHLDQTLLDMLDQLPKPTFDL